MFYFTPLWGFFSPFPHGTRSLSVTTEYLALEDGPPSFKQGFSCPALLTNGSRSPNGFAYETITRSGAPSHPASAPICIFDFGLEIRLKNGRRTTPSTQRPNACTSTV